MTRRCITTILLLAITLVSAGQAQNKQKETVLSADQQEVILVARKFADETIYKNADQEFFFQDETVSIEGIQADYAGQVFSRQKNKEDSPLQPLGKLTLRLEKKDGKWIAQKGRFGK